jgi:hypothetical protein
VAKARKVKRSRAAARAAYREKRGPIRPRRSREARRNPSATPSTREQLRAAISRFTGFRAQPPGRVDRGRIAAPGKVVFALGRVLMIGYSTVRAGRRFDYAHEFKSKARPLLVASSDGRNLFLLGGAYRVSNDGIVDTL